MPNARPRATDALSVGELAARSGVAVSAIHFYEREGLIAGWRTGANHRRFHRSTLRRLAVIRIAQRLGLPLAEIRNAFRALPDDHAPDAQAWQQLSGLWRGDLDRRIAELTRLRDQLDFCIGCGCLSMKTCPIYNPDDALAERGPGAHRF